MEEVHVFVDDALGLVGNTVGGSVEWLAVRAVHTARSVQAAHVG